MNPYTTLTPDVEAQIRARINPEYAGTLGTESHERVILLAEIDRLRGEVDRITVIGQGHIRRAEQFKDERDALSGAPMAALTDAQIDSSLDAILRASGSALEHYTMAKTRDGMRAALRAALAHWMGSAQQIDVKQPVPERKDDTPHYADMAPPGFYMLGDETPAEVGGDMAYIGLIGGRWVQVRRGMNIAGATLDELIVGGRVLALARRAIVRAAATMAEAQDVGALPNARLTGPQRDDQQTTEGHDHE